MSGPKPEHQQLIDFLEQEVERRKITPTELSRELGWHGNQLNNILNGRQPGLKLCLDIARFFKQPIISVLYKAGHITEEEWKENMKIPGLLTPEDMALAYAIRGAGDEKQREKIVRGLLVLIDLFGDSP